MQNQDLKVWDELAVTWATQIKPNYNFSDYLIQDGLTALLNNLTGKKVLDAGCGDGTWTNFVSNLGGDTIGIDGSENMLAMAKKNYSHIKFDQMDLLKPLAFDSNQFDVVVASMVLFSLQEISTFLSESARVLKANGTMVVAVPHPCFNNAVTRLYKSLLDKLLFRKPKGLIKNYYTKTTHRHWEKGAEAKLPYYHRTLEEYSQEFKQAGFAITEMYEPHTLPKQALEKNPKIEYTTRIPRFIFFKLKLL